MYKILLLSVFIPIIGGKLVIFQYKNNYIGNYVQFFSHIDENIIVLEPDFTIEEFNNAATNATGFILPGGTSLVHNKQSKYWEYTNLVFQQNKPIIGICNGFHHILKHLNINHPFDRCMLKGNLIINNKIHNHQWCTQQPPKNFNYTTFTHNNKTYIETFYNDKLYATIYHPEKIMQCNYKVNNCKELGKVAYSDLVKFAQVLKYKKDCKY